MNATARPTFRAWPVVLLCAAGLLLWLNHARVQRVEEVTRTDAEDAIVDPVSPTGYAGGKRWLIVPEHNNRSYQWLAETQQMLARGEWRVRHIDTENAPLGRPVYSASPYRWWLGVVAWCDHTLSGRPPGLAVERAALWADPLLHLLLLVGTTIFVARQFGNFPAALFAAGLALLFPLAGSFLPGTPDDRGLALACALWSVLPLLAGVRASGRVAAAEGTRPMRRLFLIAGIAGGLGMWVNASRQAPVVIGIGFGALLAAWCGTRDAKARTEGEIEIAPWRLWGFSGAATCLLAYLLEYFPSHMELRLEVNHPLYGLAWLGLGELLAQVEGWIRRRKIALSRRELLMLTGALLAVAALPAVAAAQKTPAFLIADATDSRLTSLPFGAVAKNLRAWIARDHLSGGVIATCLPVLLFAPLLWRVTRSKGDAPHRAAIAVGLGAALVAFVLACSHLAWWPMFDGLALAAVVAAASEVAPASGFNRGSALWSGLAALVFLPGLVQLRLPAEADHRIVFTPLEVEGLIERSLAHWLADRAGPTKAVVLLPPDRTTSWCFHGGLRGLGTAGWENREGLAATVRIVSATSVAEAFALISERGVTHLVLPSWDPDLDQFARWSVRNPEDAFIAGLRHWSLPPWLRPIPYNLPTVAGFEEQSVVILEVTDESSRALSVSRLAEYFVETQRLEQATAAIPALERYPTDLGAMVALAQVQKARGDGPAFDRIVGTLVSGVENGSDRSLAWERRVSLAIVLAQAGRDDLAREQTRRCFEKLNEARLRSLTTASLFRLQVLGHAFGQPISEPLRELARKLLPPELRAQLPKE